MDTLLIQITNHKALQLLRDLEDLNLIKVLKRESPKSQKLSEKYAGSISGEAAEKLQEELKNIRKEWDDRDI